MNGKGVYLILKYSDLESFVKSHLLASFSVSITLSTSTKDRKLYFTPQDSMKRLLESTGKDIPVTVNGKLVEWGKQMELR